jgi:FKBP-type peptidyl-prolyl cis-trans isomerase
MMMSRKILSCLLLVSTVSAFGIPSQNAAKTGVSSMQGSLTATRATFLQSLLLGALAIPPAVAAESVTLPNGVVYTVVKQGTGPKPDRGELVAIRFAAYAGDTQIDNIFDTPEPYYTRLGSGALLPGVEQTLPLMQLGDRWRLTIPVRFYCRLITMILCSLAS